jgi:cytoskeletal protein RodZ
VVGFGEKFRQERERRGLTLDDVSNVTKISSRMLKAIEQERFDILPGGVFNKGFIRAYAKTLSFNPDESVSEYLSALSQAQMDAQNAPWVQPSASSARTVAQPSQKTTSSDRDSKDATNPALSTLPSPSPARTTAIKVDQARSFESASPLPIPLVQPPATKQQSPPPLWISPSPKRPSSPAVSQPPAKLPPVTKPAQSPELPQPLVVTRVAQNVPKVATEELVPSLLSDQVMASTENEPATPAASGDASGWKIPLLILAVGVIVIAAILWAHRSRQLALGDKTAKANSSANPQAGVVTAGAEQSGSSNAPASSSNIPASSASVAQIQSSKSGADVTAEEPESLPVATKTATRASAVEPTAPAAFRVAIRASKNCWISVTADGALVSRENLIAPANTSVKASHEITVQVSDPAAITFRWNDRAIPTQGAEEAKTFVFDNSGLRTSTQ